MLRVYYLGTWGHSPNTAPSVMMDTCRACRCKRGIHESSTIHHVVGPHWTPTALYPTALVADILYSCVNGSTRIVRYGPPDHCRYCSSGDNTLEAIEKAVEKASVLGALPVASRRLGVGLRLHCELGLRTTF